MKGEKEGCAQARVINILDRLKTYIKGRDNNFRLLHKESREESKIKKKSKTEGGKEGKRESKQDRNRESKQDRNRERETASKERNMKKRGGKKKKKQRNASKTPDLVTRHHMTDEPRMCVCEAVREERKK